MSIATAPVSAARADAETETTQKPSLTFTQIREALAKTQIYSVHPEVLAMVDHSRKDLEHVEKVRRNNQKLLVGEKPQTEFLMVRLPKDMTPREVRVAAEVIHQVRNKDKAPTHDKVTGLMERGYMLVSEASAVGILRKVLPPSSIISAGGPSVGL